jgi:hypothetical protein
MVMLTAVSCGTGNLDDGASAASAAPTLGHRALSPDEAESATSTSSTEAALLTETPPIPTYEPPGPPLDPLASAELIKVAIEEAHGPTDDIAGNMNRFVSFPDVPTPAGAEIIDLRADVRDTLDGTSILVTAEVTVEAAGPVDELATFYRSALTELGWQESTPTDYAEGPGRLQRQGYAIPDSAYDLDDFVVELSEVSEVSDGTVDPALARARLRYVELLPAGDVAARERLEGWAGELPLPQGGLVTGAGIQTVSVGRHSLFYSLALRYDGIDAGTVATEFRSLLPTDAYAIDPQPQFGDKLDNWVYLDNSYFAESRLSTHQPLTPPETLLTLVNFDARVEFDPS